MKISTSKTTTSEYTVEQIGKYTFIFTSLTFFLMNMCVYAHALSQTDVNEIWDDSKYWWLVKIDRLWIIVEHVEIDA